MREITYDLLHETVLSRRRDLKLIVTSATMNAAKVRLSSTISIANSS